MRSAMQKFFRDTIESSVVSSYRKQQLNFDQYASGLLWPSLPRIVVYSQTQGVQKLLDQIFPLYEYITPTPQSQSDEIIARGVAERLLIAPQKGFGGYLIKGFPFNTNQALMLDRYLNGINLALHIKSENEPVDESINNLLAYYNQRGTLLRLPFISDPTSQQFEKYTREIVANIKNNQ